MLCQTVYVHACSWECVAAAVLHVWPITERWPVAALHVRISICVCMCVCTCMWACHTHSHACMRVCACVCMHACERACVIMLLLTYFVKKKDFLIFSFCFPEQCCSFTLHWWYISKKISLIFIFALSLPPEPVRLPDKLNLKETNFKRSGKEVRGGGKG